MNTPGRTVSTSPRNPCSPVRCWTGVPVHRRHSARPNRFASAVESPSSRRYRPARSVPRIEASRTSAVASGWSTSWRSRYPAPRRTTSAGRIRSSASPSASWAARSAWFSRSTKPSSSGPPASTSWSWCDVYLIRWSVTRPSGKLYVRIFSERSPVPSCERRAAASFACASSMRLLQQARPQVAHRLLAVLELGALLLTFDLDAGRSVHDPHGRVGGVHGLAARSARAVDVDLEVLGTDLDLDLLGRRRARPRWRSTCGSGPGTR